MNPGPGCRTCHGAGWVRTPSGDAFDACGECARRAELLWQTAQAASAAVRVRDLEDAA